MKVFLSWSGLRSRTIAEALNDWLRRVIQAVKPFYSPEIEKGAKWSSEIDDALEGTRFGIICLTPDNLKSTWIHYEAGALSKTKDALIWTFLHGLTPGDISPPLGKFQHTVAEKDDVLRLLKTINGRLGEVGGEPLQDRLLEENFELFWPKLEGRLKEAEKIIDLTTSNEHNITVEMPRDERAILDEVLEIVRSQERRLIGFEERLFPNQTQPAKRVTRGTKRYNELQIPIPSDHTQEPEAIARKLAEVLRTLLLDESAVTIEITPTGPVVRAKLDPPQSEGTAVTLINLASKEAHYEALEWRILLAE